MSCQTKFNPKDYIELEEDHFDFYMDQKSGISKPVKRFTWRNSNNLVIQVINYGATITSIQMPNNVGNIDDIVMGFDNMQGYLNKENPYFGATIGRVANRIGNSQITIDNHIFNLQSNLGIHQLHGGPIGFDKILWDYYVYDKKLVLSHLSPDGDQGYPGACLVNVTFELHSNNEFLIQFQATTTKSTYVNLTNHSYFNLAGHNTGSDSLYKHKVCINANRITKTDQNSIPTGDFLSVVNTVFDLRISKQLQDVINEKELESTKGYDQNFCIEKGCNDQGVAFIARVEDPLSGRVLEVYSDQPGVQFYTSNFLPTSEDIIMRNQKNNMSGKNNAIYMKHGAFCLETQNYPDAINHSNFPKAILRPNEIYKHTLKYRFYVN